MRFQLFLCLFLLPFVTLAQPGGGGGAYFRHFGVPGKDYTSELCLKHMKLQLMSGVHSNIIDSEQKEIRSLNLEHNGWSARYAGQEYRQVENHYRLVWKEDNDSMVVIFTNLMPENGAGYSETFDSLVFMPGHYELRLSQDRRISGYESFTPRTHLNWFKEMAAKAYFPTRPTYSFYYYYNAAHQENSRVKYEDSEPHLIKAQQMAEGFDQKKLVLTERIRFHRLKFNNETALNLALELDSLCCSVSRIDNSACNVLIEIYTERKEFDKALPYYTRLSKEYNDESHLISEALFLEMKLNRSEEAIAICELLLQRIPEDHMKQYPIGVSPHAETILHIGEIFWHANKPKEAKFYFELAIQVGAFHTSDDRYVNLFATYIEKFPTETTFYICRAAANIGRAPYLGWGNMTRIACLEAMEDCDNAMRIGRKDFLVNYTKGQAMQLIKKNEDGLKVADECIRLEPKDPRGYLLKSMFYNDIRTEDAMKKAEECRVEFRKRLESFKFKFHY
jgi:tetratricopeptide (TPR) repeat protein